MNNSLDFKAIGIAFATSAVAVLIAGYAPILDSLFAGDIGGAKVALASLVVGALVAGVEAARQKLASSSTMEALRSLRRK